AAHVAHIVHRLNLVATDLPAPTGVGFCMYLKREAMTSVGAFDEAFGPGYGEEVDWCQRALERGWTHRISTRVFVFHAGTKSFVAEEKQRLIARHTRLVNSRHPDYQ